MDPHRWNRLNEIFDAACEVADDERSAFLDRACADDPALRAEIQALFDEGNQVHGILDGVAMEAAGLLDDLSKAGRQVGSYLLLRRLGIGGMGEVYLAERADGQFEHQVAVKLVRSGLDSRHILARFRSERQILARLEHPNIARLLDGGLTEQGQPYFVMEYIDGRPIDEYAAAHALSVDERLDLLTQVCRAVTYAHANLVIHRDLKPSNILVTAEGQVKLLDFGIAKVIQEDEEDPEPLTRTGAGVMTPAYASPEQARGEPVNTSTDIYSLGVVLYELLTGVRPYDVDGRNPAEAARVICEVEPDRPSTAITRTRSGDTTTAETGARTGGDTRGLNPDRLRRRLAGDLDVICLKALRKDAARRYVTADEMREDIRRHLDELPIQARAESVGYRVGKFVRRHRAGVSAAAVVVLLVAGVVGFYTDRLKQERDRARLEAEKAAQVAAFLQSIFETSDPSESRGETVTARELLDDGARRLEEELAGQPVLLADLLGVVGNVYGSLWLLDEALPLLERAYQLTRTHKTARHPDVAKNLVHIAGIRALQGRYAEADSLYQEALTLQRDLLDEPHPDVAETLNALGGMYTTTGAYEQSEQILLESLAQHEAVYGEDAPETATALNALGQLYQATGEYPRAEPFHQRALELRRDHFGETHPNVAVSVNNLAGLYRLQGRFDEALPLYQEALAMTRRIYGETHPRTALSLNNLSALLKARESYAEAEDYQRQAYEIFVEALGEEHPHVAMSLNNLANLRHDQGDYAEAERLHRESLALNAKLFGEDHPRVAGSLNNVAALYLDQGRFAEAATTLREVLRLDRAALGEQHPFIAMDLQNLAIALTEQRAFAEAESLLRASVAMNRALLGDDHPDTAIATVELGRVLLYSGATAEADSVLHSAVRLCEAALPEGSWRTAGAHSLLGELYTQTGRLAEAEPLLLESHAALEQAHGAQHRATRDALRRVVDLYLRWDRPEQAAPYRARLREAS